MNKYVYAIICWPIFFAQTAITQSDSTAWLQRVTADTSKPQLNMDAVYNRPFLQAGKMPVALGGYVESKVEYLRTDGI